MQGIKQMFDKRFVLIAMVLASFSLPLSGAQAALVTYSFTGSVSNISGALLSSSMNLTSPVSGSFQFDNSINGSGGVYPAVTALTVTVGGYTSNYLLGANAVTISPNTSLGGGMMGDRWKLDSATTGTQFNGFSPESFDLRLDREGGGLFANTNLQNPPSLNMLTATRWRLVFEDSDGNLVNVRGALNSLTAVPLPAAVVLFGIGLISLVGLGAGGLRNLRGSQM